MADIAKLVIDTVFKYLTRKNLFTIPRIVEETGLSITTISKYVSGMLELDILELKGTVKTGGRGRQAIMYGLKNLDKYLLGVDVKSDMLIMSLMDLSGEIVKTDADRSFRYENSADSLEQVCLRIEKFASDHSASIAQMCMILGGRVNTVEGTSASNFIVEELDGTPLADYLEERLGFPVRIENDTKAMAYGEYLSGDRTKYDSFLYINIGWGLGLGIIMNGELYHGKNGYSGEFGHIHAYDNDILCHCGKKGCLETEVSGRAIHRKLIEQMSCGKSSTLYSRYRQGMSIGMDDIMAAADKEDPLCIDLISKAGSELGEKLASLINIFDPDCIIIGGSLSRAASYYFLYPIRAAIRKYALKLISKDVVIELSSMGEEAGTVGACLIAKQQYFGRVNEDIAGRLRII